LSLPYWLEDVDEVFFGTIEETSGFGVSKRAGTANDSSTVTERPS
jgi:hypothetical protein